MKIGYPCINNSLSCTANSTFRLVNYSPENLKEKVSNNLDCLQEILSYNVEQALYFFRISSDLIPFASHPVNTFPWEVYFQKRLKKLGNYIKKNKIRISMHPDQFVLLNAQKKEILQSSLKELSWHCRLLDLMGLSSEAKIQIHVGGVYGDKEKSKKRFIKNYQKLPALVKKRLAIENDDRSYSLQDCLEIYKETGIPIIFDFFHHQCLNNGEGMREALEIASKTWKKRDGVMMTDYSSQEPRARKGKHVEKINLTHFKKYLDLSSGLDFDIMLEVRDKEKSALKVVRYINQKKKGVKNVRKKV